jgi:hypothetical protein
LEGAQILNDVGILPAVTTRLPIGIGFDSPVFASQENEARRTVGLDVERGKRAAIGYLIIAREAAEVEVSTSDRRFFAFVLGKPHTVLAEAGETQFRGRITPIAPPCQ